MRRWRKFWHKRNKALSPAAPLWYAEATNEKEVRPMANKKLKLLYLARFFQQETDEQHPKTLQEMIAYLASYDISAERKSIYDDIELLRLFGMDIQTVKAKNFGYFLGER